MDKTLLDSSTTVALKLHAARDRIQPLLGADTPHEIHLDRDLHGDHVTVGCGVSRFSGAQGERHSPYVPADTAIVMARLLLAHGLVDTTLYVTAASFGVPHRALLELSGFLPQVGRIKVRLRVNAGHLCSEFVRVYASYVCDHRDRILVRAGGKVEIARGTLLYLYQNGVRVNDAAGNLVVSGSEPLGDFNVVASESPACALHIAPTDSTHTLASVLTVLYRVLKL